MASIQTVRGIDLTASEKRDCHAQGPFPVLSCLEVARPSGITDNLAARADHAVDRSVVERVPFTLHYRNDDIEVVFLESK
jgi:hypothetical protein